MPDDEYPPPNPPPSWPPPPGGYYAPLPPPVPPVNATLILVFGILGIVLSLTCGILGIVLSLTCGIGGVFGIVAWIMGNSARQTLDRVGDPLNQRGTVNAGRICGIVGAVLMVVGILFYVAFFGIGIFASLHDHSKGV